MMTDIKIFVALILGLALLSGLTAHASEYKLFYLNDRGQQIEASDAILASVKGSAVYKCQSVEAKVSKAGTSIGMRGVKRPKTEK